MNDAKLDKIRKLLAQAEGAGTPQEAETFSQKAIALATEYGIDLALAAAEGKKTDEIGMRRIAISGSYSVQKGNLLGYIASALGARWIIHHGASRKTTAAITIFGFESTLEQAELLYTSLLLQASSQVAKVTPEWWMNESTAAYRRSWFQGFAAMIYNRVLEAQKAAVAQADAEAPSGTPGAELVLVSRKEQVDKAYAEAFPNLGKARRSKLSGSGYAQGGEAGRRADIGGKRIGKTDRVAIG